MCVIGAIFGHEKTCACCKIRGYARYVELTVVAIYVDESRPKRTECYDNLRSYVINVESLYVLSSAITV